MSRHAHIAIAIGLAMIGLMVLSLELGKKPEPVVVTLVAGPPQPRVPPAEGGLDPAALQLATDYAGRHRSSALVVGRGGHIVFEHYWNGTTNDTPVVTGFDPVLAALVVGSVLEDRLVPSLDTPLANYIQGVPADAGSYSLRELLAHDHAELALERDVDLVALTMERVTHQPYEQLVAERLWKRLGGGSLEFQRRGSKLRAQGVSAACCVQVRLGDWMRVGELLANDGSFEGDPLTRTRFVTQMLHPTHRDSPHGYFTRVDGSFAAHDVAWLEGTGKQRLWVVPSLKLVILRVGEEPSASEGWDEAMIPDTIIRGTSGWQPSRPAGGGVDPNLYAPH